MSMSEAGDILDEATRGVPEEIMDNEKVESAMTYLFGWLDRLTDWIDPESDGYREELYEERMTGAYAVVDRYQSMLKDALYRQKMFGTQFDLEQFVDALSKVEIHEVLEGAL